MPVDRQPDSGLIQPCDVDARIPPGKLNDNQKSALMIRLGELLSTCARQHGDLIDFVLAGKK